MSEWTHRFEREPICPYCGHKDRDAWEINFGPGLEGDTEHMCHKCERDYLVQREVQVTYSTAPLEDSPITSEGEPHAD